MGPQPSELKRKATAPHPISDDDSPRRPPKVAKLQKFLDPEDARSAMSVVASLPQTPLPAQPSHGCQNIATTTPSPPPLDESARGSKNPRVPSAGEPGEETPGEDGDAGVVQTGAEEALDRLLPEGGCHTVNGAGEGKKDAALSILAQEGQTVEKVAEGPKEGRQLAEPAAPGLAAKGADIRTSDGARMQSKGALCAHFLKKQCR